MTNHRLSQALNDSQFSLQVLHDSIEIDRLRNEWIELYRQQGNRNFAHKWEWLSSLLKRVFPANAFVCVLRDKGQVVFIHVFKLQARRIAGKPLNILEAIANPHYIYFTDSLIKPSHSKPELLEVMLNKLESCGVTWDILHYENILEGSSLHTLLEQHRSLHKNNGFSAYLDTPSIDSLTQVSKKMRREIRRLKRKIETEFRDYKFFIGRTEHVQKDIQDFIRLEGSGWKGKGGKSSSLNCQGETAINFFSHIHKTLAPSSESITFFLEFSEIRVSSALVLRAGRTLYIHKLGYDENFSTFGPGAVLCFEILQWAAEHKDIDRVSFITKPRWHLSSAPLYGFNLYNSELEPNIIETHKKSLQRLYDLRNITES
ncbi:MAG: CelD/BcsL family acetyltransferase involved in cellulose biosynthesis [Flavobacteriales bacterium]|jgi:CelD/BcsL family acetyltransferase involved in cellulose biosynthesis